MKSFFPILTLIFITLKLIGTISWSWWLVLLPLYGPLVVFLILAAIMVLAAAFVERLWK